ncbi:MAG: TIGR02147 family protein [Bacteriovoracaceae bacterium]|nr:TIGR02147 family protein [Bacteriovoracaceae bacterium]
MKDTEAKEQFKVFLQGMFEECKLKNPSYSLRAFAKKIGIAPSTTSQVLSGKRNLSFPMAKKITERLALSLEQEKKLLLPYIQGRPYSKDVTRDMMKTSYSKLSEAQFDVISKWYHFAILSLMELGDYENFSEYKDAVIWMARKINMPQSTIKNALSKLQILGLIQIDIEAGSKPEITGQSFTSTDEVESSAVKKAHCDSFSLATRSLMEDKLEVRDFNSMTLAINPSQIPKAKQIIRKCLDELDVILAQGCKEEVYHVSVQLFPLTELKRETQDRLNKESSR